MRLRHWLATAAGLAFLVSLPAIALAQDASGGQPTANGPPLPQPCVDAGITDQHQCVDFLRKQKHGQQQDAQPKPTPAANPPGGQQPAAGNPPSDNGAGSGGGNTSDNQPNGGNHTSGRQLQLPQPCVDAGITDPRKCSLFVRQQETGQNNQQQQVQQPAATGESAGSAGTADGGGNPKNNTAGSGQPKARELPQACVDAGITDPRKCSAFIRKQQTGQNNQQQQQQVQPPAPTGETVTSNGGGNPPATGNNTAGAGNPSGGKPARLPRDCIQAGVKTQAECDALHAISGQKGTAGTGQPSNGPTGGNPPANGNAPATAEGGPAPTPPAGPTPEVTGSKNGAPQLAVEPPPPAPPAPPDITRDLTTLVQNRNKAIADIAQNGDNPGARKAIKNTENRIAALCKTNHIDDIRQCAAQYGLTLAELPPPGGTAPVAVVPVQPVEVLPNLPKDVKPSEVAPLLDSAKDQEAGKGPAPGGKPLVLTPEAAAALNAPPPANDKAAQAHLKPTKIVPIDQTQGQKITANAGTPPPQISLPQNVTIINQTVNNSTNVQNNYGTPGQQVVVGNNPPGNGFPSGPGGRPGPSNGGPGNGPGGFPGHGPGPGFPGGPPPVNPIGLGLNIILQVAGQTIVNSPAMDQLRISNGDRDNTTYEQLPGGRFRETIFKPDGSRVVTIYNRNGDIIRRSRFDRAGHEIVLAYFDDRYDNDLLNWRDPGADLPPLQLRIPARDYVLDADYADQSQVQDFFAQPPVEPVQRLYSIDEVKRSARIRDMVRRLEIGDLTFDTGQATIPEDQVGALANVAGAMLDLLNKNPAETFLIEGHTDAVGSDQANLILSDARAATVARILTDFYHIPPENLATQGYGERFLKVQTDGPERLNRRVTIRRITPLITVATQNY